MGVTLLLRAMEIFLQAGISLLLAGSPFIMILFCICSVKFPFCHEDMVF